MRNYDEYKKPKNDWIGKIPIGWITFKFRYIFEEINERTLTGSEELLSLSKYHGVVPRNKITNKLESAASLIGYKKCRKGDLVMNKLQAWNGMFDISNFNGLVSPDYTVFRLKMKAKYNMRYLLHLLTTPKYVDEFTKRSSGIGDGFFRLYTPAFNAIYAITPTHKEQTAIATFLDQKTTQIDDAIAQKEQLIELLKERKQIIIQRAVTRGLDETVEMKDSGVDWIGEVPGHWDTYRVKNIFRLIIDPAPDNNNMELLSIYTNIGVRPRQSLEQKGNRASTTDGYWKVKKGDFIVNKLLAWMGAVGLSEYEGVTSPAYDILRPVVPMNVWFYHFLFRTKLFQGEMKKQSRGIMEMRLRLYFDKFGDIRVPFPPKEDQDKIVSSLNLQFEKIDRATQHQTQQITKLREYRTVLIDAAVTGKIKVS